MVLALPCANIQKTIRFWQHYAAKVLLYYSGAPSLTQTLCTLQAVRRTLHKRYFLFHPSFFHSLCLSLFGGQRERDTEERGNEEQTKLAEGPLDCAERFVSQANAFEIGSPTLCNMRGCRLACLRQNLMFSCILADGSAKTKCFF